MEKNTIFSLAGGLSEQDTNLTLLSQGTTLKSFSCLNVIVDNDEVLSPDGLASLEVLEDLQLLVYRDDDGELKQLTYEDANLVYNGV